MSLITHKGAITYLGCTVINMSKQFEEYKACYTDQEYIFLPKDPGVLEDLKCPICLELVHEAQQTSPCGHVFCAGCIKVKDHCPVCRSECQIFADNRTARQIRNLKVKCLNSQRGCKWQGELGNCEDHKTKKCPFQTTACPLKCGKLLQKQKVKKHTEEECKLRSFNCPHCKKQGVFDLIVSSHYTVCSNFPISCPAGCRLSIKRSGIKAHLATCQEELVACEYAQIGCTTVMKRKDLDKHMKENKDSHLNMCMSSVNKMAVILTQMCLTGQSVAPPLTPWLSTTPSQYPLPPTIIKIDNVDELKKSKVNWFSNPLYSHAGGYKFRMNVYINGNGAGDGSHLSVFFCLMRGENDDNLTWPFRGTIMVSLLNQLWPERHHRKAIVFDDENPNISGCVQEVERESGLGHQTFIPHSELTHREEQKCCFLQNNHLYFRIDNIDIQPGDFRNWTTSEASSVQDTLQRPWLSVPLTYQPPYIIKLTQHMEKRMTNADWYSEPFYSHYRGYKMCLNILPGGHGTFKGTHVSVYIYLMKGENDAKLKWPFRGTVIVSLLNQLQNDNHHTQKIVFSEATPIKSSGRVTKANRAKSGSGSGNFISNNALKPEEGTSYLQEDCLYFRIDSILLKQA